MGKTTRGLRRNASVGGRSVEFCELLDPIAEAPVHASAVISPTAVDLPDRHVDVVDVDPDADAEHEIPIEVADPPRVSRFADAGLDDDRLPLHTSTKRRRRG